VVQNVTPPAPPSSAITIQPLTTPAGSQESASLALRNIPIGALVEGFVVNRDAHQNPILRTSVGDVLVKSEIFLKTGSEVVFRIDANIESRARIISIDHMNPQDYAAKMAIIPASDEVLHSSLLPDSRMTAITANQTARTPPIILSAFLLSPNVLPTQGLPPAIAQYWTQIMTSLQKDAALIFKIISTELPLPSQSPTTASPAIIADPRPITTPPITQSTQSAPATPKASAPQAGSIKESPIPSAPTQATALPLAVTTTIETKPVVANIQPTLQNTVPNPATSLPAIFTTPPATPIIAQPDPKRSNTVPTAPLATTSHSIPQPTTTTPIPQLTAHVIGHEFDGANIIQTPIGTFKLLSAHPLPTGSKLTLEIPTETRSAPLVSTSLLPSDLEDFTNLARDWSSLRDAVTIIAAHDPALATQLIHNSIPKPHAKMTSEMLFLFAAIKSGSPEEWFGKRAIEVLDLRSPEILKRLTSDFAQLQQVFSDALPQWMSVVVPFYSDAQLQQIRMFFKHEDDAGNKGKDGEGQRFIIELDLSQLGDMQLDGFIKKTSQIKHFDLVVRSARPLPEDVEKNIRHIFDTALQTTGYKGLVNFQQGIYHFVRPLESIKEALSVDTHTLFA
jgi:hypothetical protein